MPYLHVHTNVAVADAETLIKALSTETASALGKPESYVMVQCSGGQAMCFAGTDAPLAFVELKSLGLSSAKTVGLSERICELLQARLGIDSVRSP